MSHDRAIAARLARQPIEIARWWLEAHLEVAFLEADRQVIRQVHDRSGAVVEALRHALSARSPTDWSSFGHREAVQLVASMANALAEAGVSAGAAAALVPALIRACERADVDEPAKALIPLVAVAGEGFLASIMATVGAGEQARLARTAPVQLVPGGIIIATPHGALDRAAAEKIAERVLRMIIKRSVDAALVVLDLSFLEVDSPDPVDALLDIGDDVAGLGGSCLVCGLEGGLEDLARRTGRDLAAIPRRASLEAAISERLRPGLLSRLRRRR